MNICYSDKILNCLNHVSVSLGFTVFCQTAPKKRLAKGVAHGEGHERTEQGLMLMRRRWWVGEGCARTEEGDIPDACQTREIHCGLRARFGSVLFVVVGYNQYFTGFHLQHNNHQCLSQKQGFGLFSLF